MLSRRPEIARRCRDELIGWFTTVSPDVQPQTSAVWHVVDGDDLVVYSRADATRLVNLAHNPRIAYNLRGDRRGNHVVTMEGRAQVDRELPAPDAHPGYVAKYSAEMERIGWTPATYAADFPVGLRITINRIRSW